MIRKAGVLSPTCSLRVPGGRSSENDSFTLAGSTLTVRVC
jgi:hypothetical protein